MANVLIIGRRKRCYRAVISLGHRPFLWSDGPLHESRKNILAGWVEDSFGENEIKISNSVLNKLKTFGIQYVVAATESSVDLAASIRHQLNIEGTPLEVSHLLHNKYEMKKAAVKHQIPITNFHLIQKGDSPEFLVKKLGLPLVVKPISEAGARGVVVIRKIEDVAAHAKPGLLAEAFVDGTEISVETFIHDGKAIFHNITDYLHQWKKSIMPAQLDQELKERVLSINDKVISAFNVKNGMTHSEFYLSKNGPIFGEMAVRPPGGYYMELIEEAYGFDPWKVYVQLECGGKKPELPSTAKKHASVYIIYPGKGTVSKIDGLDSVREIKENFEFKFKLKVGDSVLEHVSTSNECGHSLMSSTNYDILLDRIDFIEKNLKIELV